MTRHDIIERPHRCTHSDVARESLGRSVFLVAHWSGCYKPLWQIIKMNAFSLGHQWWSPTPSSFSLAAALPFAPCLFSPLHTHTTYMRGGVVVYVYAVLCIWKGGEKESQWLGRESLLDGFPTTGRRSSCCILRCMYVCCILFPDHRSLDRWSWILLLLYIYIKGWMMGKEQEQKKNI